MNSSAPASLAAEMIALRGIRRIGKRDVVVDRAVEQEVLLQDDADLAAQPASVDVADVDAV